MDDHLLHVLDESSLLMSDMRELLVCVREALTPLSASLCPFSSSQNTTSKAGQFPHLVKDTQKDMKLGYTIPSAALAVCEGPSVSVALPGRDSSLNSVIQLLGRSALFDQTRMSTILNCQCMDGRIYKMGQHNDGDLSTVAIWH